ncbi:MAG: hypothetical protein H7123_08115 [Thermoleophilia bacterium]|nr:hypothetical protein [Thermoleophilia bacterium]
MPDCTPDDAFENELVVGWFEALDTNTITLRVQDAGQDDDDRSGSIVYVDLPSLRDAIEKVHQAALTHRPIEPLRPVE